MIKPETAPVVLTPEKHYKEMLDKHSANLLNIIKNLIERGDKFFLGEGRTAKVFYIGSNPGLCIKVVEDPGSIEPEANIGLNSVQDESMFQSQLVDINTGCRVPKPYVSWLLVDSNTGKRKEVLIMETLPADSLRDIFEGKAEMPDSFDMNTFFDALNKFIVQMHDRGIYHRDLHEGNIMVDKITGMPYVIDFGYSTRSYDEDTVYVHETAPNEFYKFPKDESKLSSIRKKCLGILQEKASKIN